MIEILSVPQLYRIFITLNYFKELGQREKYVAPFGVALRQGESILLATYKKKICIAHASGQFMWTGELINELIRLTTLKEFKFIVPGDQKPNFIQALSDSGLKAGERYDTDGIVSLRLLDLKCKLVT